MVVYLAVVTRLQVISAVSIIQKGIELGPDVEIYSEMFPLVIIGKAIKVSERV